MMNSTLNALAVLAVIVLHACNSGPEFSNDTGSGGTPAAEKKALPQLGEKPAVVSDSTAGLIQRSLVGDILKNDLASLAPEDRKFSFQQIDLNGDTRKEILVAFQSSYFCGTGGCTVLLLDSTGGLINRFTVVQYPIMILPSSTKGWHDLLMISGSAKPGAHLVRWNGSRYPGNPSMEPEFTADIPEAVVTVFDFSRVHTDWLKF